MIVLDETSDSFGNRLIELRSPPEDGRGAVRVIKDRGLWSVEIEVAGAWRGPRDVLLAMDDAPYSRRAESHAGRYATTLAVVDRLPLDASLLVAIVERLAGYRREYWKTLGVAPTD